LDPIALLLREDHKRVINMEVGMLDGPSWKSINNGAIGSKAAFLWTLSHFWEPEMTAARIHALSGEENPNVNHSPITYETDAI
jgi:hypothetical protein